MNSSDNLIWHYTTLDTLEKILESNSLLATEASFQNDPSEVSYARGLIDAALVRARERHSGPGNVLRGYVEYMDEPNGSRINLQGLLDASRFLLCGSSDGDSMYCWRTYGDVGTVGCAIGLDPAMQLGIEGSLPNHAASWQSVSYSSADMQEEVDTLIDTFVRDYMDSGDGPDRPDLGELIIGYASLETLVLSKAKSPSYADEKESRITVRNPPPSAIKFGAGKSGPRPRIALKAVGPTQGGTREHDDDVALPIRAIRLGPTSPRGAERSLRWLLTAHGYSIDGVYEEEEYESENGHLGRNRRLNQTRKVNILTSRHEFRDV